MTTKQDILKFLQENNKPHSLNNIVEKCGKDIGKTTIERALNVLVGEEKVIEKQYGKQKIYFLNQSDKSDSKNLGDLEALKGKTVYLETQLKEKEEKIRKLERELKQFTSRKSISELESELMDLKQTNEVLTNKLKEFSTISVSKFSDKEKKDIEEKYAQNLKEYRKRKKICMEMINEIMEGYHKTRNHLLEDIGIETDEMVQFQIEIEKN